MATRKYECQSQCSEGPCVVTIDTTELPSTCDLRPNSWWKEITEESPTIQTKSTEDLTSELLVLICDKERTGMLLIDANKMTDKSLMPYIKSKLDKLRRDIKKIEKEIAYRDRTNPQRIDN